MFLPSIEELIKRWEPTGLLEDLEMNKKAFVSIKANSIAKILIDSTEYNDDVAYYAFYLVKEVIVKNKTFKQSNKEMLNVIKNNLHIVKDLTSWDMIAQDRMFKEALLDLISC